MAQPLKVSGMQWGPHGVQIDPHHPSLEQTRKKPSAWPRLHAHLAANRVDLRQHARLFARQVVAHGAIEARVLQVMGAVGLRRLEAARQLVLAACARLEPIEPAQDRLLDAAVEADLEMHEVTILERAPVTAVQ